MQFHELLQVAETKISLFGKGVVTSNSKILGAKLDFGNMLGAVEISTNIHDRVQVVAFAINFNGILVLVGLDVKIGSFLPVVTVALKLSLLDKNGWIKERSFTHSVLSVFLDQIISFLELLQLRIQGDCLVKHIILDVVLGGILKLALESQDFRLKPCFIQIVDFLHLRRSLAKVDEGELPNVAEGLASKIKVLC